MAAAAAAARDACCYVCLESDDPAVCVEDGQLVHGGCDCRGSGAGWAHLSCLVAAAGVNAES
jgi:hypothetical protein